MGAIVNRIDRVRRSLRVASARWRGVQLADGALLGAGIDWQLGHRDGKPGRIVVGERAWMEQGAVFAAFGGSITLGQNVFIGPHAVIYGHGGVTIGDHTLVSMHCCILSSEHAIPATSERMRDKSDLLHPTRIGSDVWLGAGVKVLGGTNIGDGCVVGAGAVVTKDLPPYSIAVGIPARVVGNREK